MEENIAPSHTISSAWLALRGAPLQAPVWLDLARAYALRGLPWQAGYAARQAVRCDPALDSQLDALEIGPWRDAAAGDGLLWRRELPDAAMLAGKFSAAVRDCPGDWLSWLYLVRVHEIMGATTVPTAGAAQPAMQQAQALEALPGESLHWLGVCRLHAGDAVGAVAALAGLLDVRPVRYGSMLYLGEALLRVGNVAAAERAFSRASLSPNPDFLMLLAARTYAQNYWQEAISVLRKALALRPDSVAAWVQLSKILWEVYELSQARECCEKVLALDPGNTEAKYMLAALPGRMGDAKGHLAAVRREYAAASDPLSRLASSVAMAALYQDELAPAEVADLHRRLCAPIEAAVTLPFPAHAPLKRRRLEACATQAVTLPFPAQAPPEKTQAGSLRYTGCGAAVSGSGSPGPSLGRGGDIRLRIAYVSGDLHRQHPVNLFLLPVLLRHDRARFEINFYYTGTMFDEYTRQAKAAVDRWVESATLDDGALRRQIMADGIDILVDLAGHTTSHRLGLFAMRAAPVQATFLGYPHSTGLSSIDWIIGDATVSPAEHAHLFSEGIAQLPDSVFCWAPLEDYPLPPPRPAVAPVVFGSFNNAMKLSPRTVALWARVLREVPDALLLLKAPSLRDENVRALLLARFAEQGVAAERLVFRGPCGLNEMMREYGEVDIALDPTPYNGGTTTLQALWMGVPVVTLEGGNFVGRMGASFLDTLGNPSWVARDEAGYVAIASNLAYQCGRLREGREALRQRMAASPLCDIAAYTRNLENLYGRMWAVYREGSGSRLLLADVGGPSRAD